VKKSLLLLISWLLVTAYLGLMLISIGQVSNMGVGVQKLAIGLAVLIFIPHLLLVAIGLLFNILGWSMNHRGFTLTAAILYSVSMIFMFINIPYIVIQTVLCYVAYAQMSKAIPVTV
jgi:hypothetical protein